MSKILKLPAEPVRIRSGATRHLDAQPMEPPGKPIDQSFYVEGGTRAVIGFMELLVDGCPEFAQLSDNEVCVFQEQVEKALFKAVVHDRGGSPSRRSRVKRR